MSTPTERLEAEVWLEATDPDISVGQRDAFFRAVDEYFVANPTADRGPHFLTTLRETMPRSPRSSTRSAPTPPEQ